MTRSQSCVVESVGERFGGIDAREIRLVAALPQILDEERRVVFRVLNQQQAQWFHATRLPGDPGVRKLLRALEPGFDRLGVLQRLVFADAYPEQRRGSALHWVHDEGRIAFGRQLFCKRVGILSIPVRGHLHRKARTGRIGGLGSSCGVPGLTRA